MSKLTCRVCTSDNTFVLLSDDRGRAYHRCANCQATLLAREHFLSTDEEHAHYLTHENDVNDKGYRDFLSRLAVPLLARLSPNSSGLDYGCGPGPALAVMMRKAGHEIAVYDPYFAPDDAAFSKAYDFITCTETVEHLHNPHDEFARLVSMLKPGGILAVMTIFQTDDERFEGWRYRQDPTHVVFYRPQTFEVIARQHGLTCEVIRKDVVFLTMPLKPVYRAV
jgi:SAM-dependent methyltransferase